MTTGEFIKLLQEEDPLGTAHLRMSGGIPMYVMKKPGYYDGPYSYIDENGNYISTSQGSKVDVYYVDLETFVYELVDTNDPDNFEKIKAKFKFDYDNYVIVSQRQDRINSTLERVKKFYDKAVAWEKDFQQKQKLKENEKLEVNNSNKKRFSCWNTKRAKQSCFNRFRNEISCRIALMAQGFKLFMSAFNRKRT